VDLLLIVGPFVANEAPHLLMWGLFLFVFQENKEGMFLILIKY